MRLIKSTKKQCGNKAKNLAEAKNIMEKLGYTTEEMSEVTERYMNAFIGVIEDHQLLGSHRLLLSCREQQQPKKLLVDVEGVGPCMAFIVGCSTNRRDQPDAPPLLKNKTILSLSRANLLSLF
jgi:hypothetical protein